MMQRNGSALKDRPGKAGSRLQGFKASTGTSCVCYVMKRPKSGESRSCGCSGFAMPSLRDEYKYRSIDRRRKGNKLTILMLHLSSPASRITGKILASPGPSTTIQNSRERESWMESQGVYKAPDTRRTRTSAQDVKESEGWYGYESGIRDTVMATDHRNGFPSSNRVIGASRRAPPVSN